MASRSAQSPAQNRARSKAQALRKQGKTAAQIAKEVGRSESWVYANTSKSTGSAKQLASTAPLNDTPRGSVSPPEGSLLRYDIRPEDVFDQETLDKIDRKFAESEANFQLHLEEGTLEDRLLTTDDLKELAERARRGEQVSLKKP